MFECIFKMKTYVVIVQSAILAIQVLCEKKIPVTNNFRNKIGLEVLKVSPVNTVVSPMGLKLPLCKLTAIATGDAKLELMSALGIDRESMTNCYESIRKQLVISELSELTMHNRIYLNDSIDPDPAFAGHALAEVGVRIGRAPFRMPKAAARFMNHWAASETLYRVSTLIEEDDIDANTSMVLLSGLHFKGNWQSPFDIRYITPKYFRDESNVPVRIPMMVKLGNFDYVDEVNYDVKVLNIKFTSMGSSITFVMPNKKDGLPALLEKLTQDPDMMTKLRNKLASAYLKIHLPRILIKTYVDWTDFLRLIGINKILDPKDRGLDGILKNGTKSEVPVHLSKAKQKVFFDLDETGLTRTIHRDANAEREERELLELGDTAEQLALDQPFYFVVTLRSFGIDHDLFNGVYRRPEQQAV